MKKVIGIVGVVMVVVAMIINVNFADLSSGRSDMDLASLISMNISNAETGGGTKLATNCRYTGLNSDTCKAGVVTISKCKKRNPPYAANCYY